MKESDRGLSRNLRWLNLLPADHAIEELLQCCGSKAWAQGMSESRPFATLDHLQSEASSFWRRLSRENWLEAFQSHPRIGERESAHQTSQRAESWSDDEQKASASQNNEEKQELRRLNLEYEKKFGFIFIICATQKSSSEILAALRRRLKNDEEKEIREAAAEQEKITEIRLLKLLADQKMQ